MAGAGKDVFLKMKICFFGTYDKKYSSNKIILDGFKRNNVKVLEVNNDIRITSLNNTKHLRVLSLINRILIKFSLIPLIFKNLDKIKKCDAIYVGYPGHIDILFAYPLAKLLGKKLIFYPLIILWITFSEDIKLFTKKSIYARLLKVYEKLIYKLPDLIYADIPLQKKIFVEEFKVPAEKIEEIPIGADDLIYKPSGIEKEIKDLKVVYYGLYSPLHGVEYILKAAKFLKKYRDIKFLMIGQGQTFDKNYRYVKKENLKNVIFYTDATEENAGELLRSGHLFFGHASKSPTVYRTLPNKVYQGLALGKVVFTVKTPATEGVFENKKDAYFFNPADAASIADGILDLRNNPSMVKRIAKNGYKLFTEKFTPSKIAKKITDDIAALNKISPKSNIRTKYASN